MSDNNEYVIERTKICPNWLKSRTKENEYIGFLLNGLYLVSIKEQYKNVIITFFKT